MSYFLVATGAVPLIDDIPALSFVPSAQAQAYVADIVSETVESCDRAVTYLLDDGTQTSDEVIAESSEQIVGGAAFETTRLGQVVLRLLEAGCTIRVWWPSATGDLPRLDVCDNRDQFLVRLIDRLGSGADLNCSYETRLWLSTPLRSTSWTRPYCFSRGSGRRAGYRRFIHRPRQPMPLTVGSRQTKK